MKTLRYVEWVPGRFWYCEHSANGYFPLAEIESALVKRMKIFRTMPQRDGSMKFWIIA